MGYNEDDSYSRVDLFKKSGKWYTTESVKWLTWGGKPKEGGKLIQDAFREALLAAGIGGLDGSYKGMKAVCLEPYHEHSHPLMIEVPE